MGLAPYWYFISKLYVSVVGDKNMTVYTDQSALNNTKALTPQAASFKVLWSKSLKIVLYFVLLSAMLMWFPNPFRNYVYGVSFTNGLYIPDAIFNAPNNLPSREVSHTFQIYNLKASNLSVEAIPSCGCIRMSWRHAVIAPFTWRNFTESVDIDGRATHIEKSVAFRTNDPSRHFAFAYLNWQRGNNHDRP